MPDFVAPARQVRCVLERGLARDHGFWRRARYVGGRIIPQPGLNMARLFWLTLMAAFAGALLLGASWAAAFYTLGDLLGAPPPEMGKQSTDFLWQGAPELPEHPRVWRFAFGPPPLPGAPPPRIYINPLGPLVTTQPAAL